MVKVNVKKPISEVNEPGYTSTGVFEPAITVMLYTGVL